MVIFSCLIGSSFRPWDNENEIRQMEHNYVIRTLSKGGTISRKINSSVSLQREQSENSDISEGMFRIVLVALSILILTYLNFVVH